MAASEPSVGALADADAFVEAMRAAYARSLSEGAAWWRAAHKAVEAGEAPAAALAEAGLRALETMRAGDPTSYGMDACQALRRWGDGRHRDRLRAVRAHLPPRKGLRDWRMEAGRALSVVEARAAGECTCVAEASHGAPVFGPQWQVEREEVDYANYCERIDVRCTDCGKAWQVERDDSYHYPTFRWKAR